MSSPAFLVRRPGLQTTVQDLGRPGFGRYGVPLGGAMDSLSLRLGNMLLDNPPGAAALELTLVGPELEALSSILFSYTGADMGLDVGGKRLSPGRVYQAREGEILRFAAARDGARAYLCLPGGLDVPQLLGSRSTAVTALLGGVDGRPLRGGDVVSALGSGGDARTLLRRRLSAPLEAPRELPVTLRLVPGPQAPELPGLLEALVAGVWTVSDRSSRIGLRLEGPALPVGMRAFPTEGVPLGAVQAPPDGAPILLLADRQTTGGYPKPAVLASADLPAAGQLRPHDQVRFELITVERAVRLLREREDELTRAVLERPAGDGTGRVQDLVVTLEKSRVEEVRLESHSGSFHWRRDR